MSEHYEVANNIRAEIRRRDMTLEDVAKKIGLSRQSYTTRLNRFARGEDVLFSFLEKTAMALEVPLTIFF
ncbi:hypothetical protein PM10SUCC1_28370 [Propionigenium maris DSM 9537]|uniref:HTH cro/C1-type domain-containing protein n=1 Tax=Propionigenium maris DSM 9537 TaxID=1123000 RepID=A0A9W6GLJ6_9FUSO|nr:helix-turn-helix domain-containing protein [Propionigenium maris]GLI57323.1 hypothetical protein PM10SUCC1_28370 [Propionigenium maris DSM 9537]